MAQRTSALFGVLGHIAWTFFLDVFIPYQFVISMMAHVPILGFIVAGVRVPSGTF